MPAIAIPDFAASRRFLITEFGADQQDQARTSAAIAAAIGAASAWDSGVVVVPPGTWPTGPVHLRSNDNLHLEKGATLLFSAKPEDYLPPVITTWEGLECLNYSPLVYAYECANAARRPGERRVRAKAQAQGAAERVLRPRRLDRRRGRLRRGTRPRQRQQQRGAACANAAAPAPVRAVSVHRKILA